jgi:hypothetical protein
LSPIARPSLSTSLLRRLPATTHLWSFSNAPRSAQLRISVQVRGKPTSPRRIVNNGPHSPSHKRSRVQSPVLSPKGTNGWPDAPMRKRHTARIVASNSRPSRSIALDFFGPFRTPPDSANVFQAFVQHCTMKLHRVPVGDGRAERGPWPICRLTLGPTALAEVRLD